MNMLSNADTSKKRILVPIIQKLPFIQKDIEILKSKFQLKTINCATFIEIVISPLYIFKTDCVFCWFGSLRFLPLVLVAKIFNKKIIIISGGYDVANVPEIQYGNMYGIIPRFLGRFLFRMADVVSSVSKTNLEETKRYAKVSSDKIKLIYHGFEDIPNNKTELKNKETIVLTVGAIDMCTVYRKGLLTSAKVSTLLPDVPFIFVGRYEQAALQMLKNITGKNVTFMGYIINKEDLHSLFLKAKVYLQPSIHEAFGCSVAEAMLYNCIPVVSNKGALPEVVGESGFCLDTDNLNEIADTIRTILNREIKFSETPRERVLRQFPINKRCNLLFNIFDSLLK